MINCSCKCFMRYTLLEIWFGIAELIIACRLWLLSFYLCGYSIKNIEGAVWWYVCLGHECLWKQ